jgi:hypothetical protein
MRKRAVVIDANIARSAGEKTACAAACAETLATIQESGHDASFCQQLLDEWEKHQSAFAGDWLASMIKSKRIQKLTFTAQDFSNFAGTFPAEARKARGFEDVHLILIAHRTGKTVLSQDDVARKLFAAIAPRKLRIYWSDPCRAQDQTLPWIAKGLPKRNDLLLSNHRD